MSCSLGTAVTHNQRPFVKFYQFACQCILRNKLFSLKLTVRYTETSANYIGFDGNTEIKLTFIQQSNQGRLNRQVHMLRQRLREQGIPNCKKKNNLIQLH